MKRIVAFSGGKDSTAAVLLMIEKGIPFDDLIFFDTGWEWPQVYEHIKKFEAYIGKKITWVKPEKDFDWWMYERPTNNPYCGGERKDAEGKRDTPNVGKGKGWPRFNLRWCTGIKQQTMKRFLKTQKPYVMVMGINADEKIRAKLDDKNLYYPLIEFNLNTNDVIELCKKHGFEWGGLYKYMNSTSCWCCPLQPLFALRNLYKYFPERWEKLKEMDSKTPTGYKIGATVKDIIKVKDLEERFKREIAEGKFDSKLTKGKKNKVV